MKLAKIAIGLGTLTLAGGAYAVNFGTTAVVNGTSYTIGAGAGANGIAVAQIGNSLSFALPNAVAINTTKTFTLTYSVFASPGQLLTSMGNILGTAGATGASNVTLQSMFMGGVGPDETSPTVTYSAGSTFPQSNYSFATPTPQWTTVTTTLTLNGLQGIAKVSTYNANYTEVVPEPASILAIGAALSGLILRRKKR